MIASGLEIAENKGGIFSLRLYDLHGRHSFAPNSDG